MKHNFGIWPLLWGATLAVGCAHYHPQPLAPEQSAARFEARRLDDPGVQAFIATNSGGLALKGAPTKWDLDALTLAGLYFHPDLAVARAQWRVAQAGVLSAGARPNPSVTFDPAYDTEIPNNPSPWMIPVSFDIPIETAGKRRKRMAEAQKAAEAARWSFISAAWQIRSGVRSSLLDFRLAGRRAGLLQQQFAAQTNIVALLQGQFAAGAIGRADLTPAQIALHKTQLDLSDALSQQADARSRLAQAVGVSLAALEGVTLDLDFPDRTAAELEAMTSAQARGVALRRRADILGALADYAAVEADLELQVARQYPDLHLGPGYGWNQNNNNDNQWSLGVTLELPILDQNQGPIAEAEAQRKLSAAKFVALQAQVCAQIERAVAGVQAARQQLRTGEELLAAEARQLKSAEAQLQAGAGSRQDWFNAQWEAASAAVTQLDNEGKFQTAVGALEDALQQPADSIAAVIQKIATENVVKGSQP